VSISFCRCQPPALSAFLAASVVDEDAAHRLGRRREEVSTAVPLLGFLGVHQAQIRFVDQRRGLERLACLLLG
jgi:hypothetical protein